MGDQISFWPEPIDQNVRRVSYRELLDAALGQVDDPEGDAISLLYVLVSCRPSLVHLSPLCHGPWKGVPQLRLVG